MLNKVSCLFSTDVLPVPVLNWFCMTETEVSAKNLIQYCCQAGS